MAVRVRMLQGDQLRAAAERLRKEDKDIPNKLRKVLYRAARPLMKEQKRRLKSLPGDGGRGDEELRRLIARGMKLRIRFGRRTTQHGTGHGPMYRIQTTVPGGKKKPNLAMLPRGLDTSFGGWRSPYFGNRHHWVHHNTHGPSWFMGPAQDEQMDLRKKLIKVLNMSAAEVAAAARLARVT